MDLAPFETLLHETMGLNPSSIGPAAIERAVRDRIRATQMVDRASYLEYVRGSASELQELIEAVIVPETWFFRDRHAFAALAETAREEWLHARPAGTLRLLSLPCSTGEEPYSMAIALLDAGISADRFRIDAVDISARALAVAERAVYSANSFRGEHLDFRDAHFQREGSGYRLADRVRREIAFQQGNLIDWRFLPGEEIYDAIFCRNLLIYFDGPTQDRAIRVLTRLLKADGRLFVGPAETSLLRAQGFTATRRALTFSFRKSSAVPPEAKRQTSRQAPVSAPRRSPAPAPPSFCAAAPKLPSASIATSPPPSIRPNPEAELAEVLRIADAGRLTEAAALGATFLKRHGPSAQAFYVLGLVHDAGGHAMDAQESYRRAIYLDPNHHEALVHLAVLLEQHGEAAAAKVLHARARRLGSRKPS